MTTLVEFTTSFGQDNFLNIIASVTAGDKQITSGPYAQPGSSPDVEIISCDLFEDEDVSTVGVSFDPLGVGVWDRRTKKYSCLFEAIVDEAIERAAE